MSFTHLKYIWPNTGFLPRIRLLYWVKRRPILSATLFGLLIVYAFCLPASLFEDPISTVIIDREEALLGARIAEDGQWRFPVMDTVPQKFATAIQTFEDKRFAYHPGVDPIALLRAIWLNVSQRKIVSGGSTLSMQVIRLARKGKARTIWEKLVEMVWATRLEWRYSKTKILSLYSSYAPFGGNVVGLNAASWKYFGRPADRLSWAESATLAVLPNAPSLIHPGKNRDLLRAKRDKLLGSLLKANAIDSSEWELALLEPLPDRPQPLPQVAPHLLDEAVKLQDGASLRLTTIDRGIQEQANAIVKRYHEHLRQNGIHNAAVVVAEVNTGAVKAYVGNTVGEDPRHGHAVNIVPARRSTGSIIKPFLYASMLSDGEILPHTLIPDIPSYFGSYHPQNFDQHYQGAVPASQALARSLNVPAVHMLSQYGVPRFHEKLRRIGMETLNEGPDHYGLTLVLGGAEGSLWNLAAMYAGMARTLNQFSEADGMYDRRAYRPLYVFQDQEPAPNPDWQAFAPLSAGAIWQTFEAMVEVARPSHESNWRQFSSASKIAWKTGTSYGFRDAWAIGVTPQYVVAVWVGNADGEGRPGLIGAQTAAPIMFDVFHAIGRHQAWFYPPYDDLVQLPVCTHSGHQPGPHCQEVDTLWGVSRGTESPLCPFHQLISLDPTQSFRVSSQCMSPLDMHQASFFVLPALQEVYYRNHHPDYASLPPWQLGCKEEVEEAAFAIVYPKPASTIYVPINLDQTRSATVFEVAHRDPEAIVYWHLDEVYLGQTKHIHQLSLAPEPGIHQLTVVDQAGRSQVRTFEVLAKS